MVSFYSNLFKQDSGMKTLQNSILLSAILVLLQSAPSLAQTNKVNRKEGDTTKLPKVALANRLVPAQEVVGAVSVITSEALRDGVDLNLMSALKGKAAGLYISEMPGAHRESGYNISIRGLNSTSFSNTTPLLIVDGIERPFEYLQHEDVASVSVLKDAIAKGFYKGKEANGVILVNTKRGAEGGNTKRISVQTGVSMPDRMPEYLSSQEYAQFYNQARRNSGLSNLYSANEIAAYASPNAQYPSNNYYDDLLNKSRNFTKVAASFSGGDEKLRYFLSAGFVRNGGLEAVGNANAMSQVNIRSNLDYQISPMVNAFLDVYGFLDMNNTNYLQANDLFKRMSTQRPNEYTYLLKDHADPDSVVYGSGRYGTSATFQNLYAEMSLGGQRENSQRIGQTSVGLNVNLSRYISGLTARAMLSFDTYNFLSIGKNDNFYSYTPVWQNGALTGQNLVTVGNKNADLSRLGTDGYRKYALLGQVNYETSWGQNHLNAGLVFNGEQNTIMFNNYKSSFQSNIVQLKYAFKNTWLAEFNGGFLGSSKLSKGDQYGFFPAAGLGWVLSEEDFMSSVKGIDRLKLRASYGITGNDDALNYFAYQTRWNYLANSDYYTYFGVDASTVARIATVETNANPSLRWEKSKEMNIGVDADLFGNWNLSVDYYNLTRTDVPIFSDAVNSQVWGLENKQINYVEIANNGLDAALSYHGRSSDFSYQAGFNMNYSLSEYKVSSSWAGLPENRNYNGKPVDAYLGQASSGIIRNQADLNGLNQMLGQVGVGDLRYQDLNGDGQIDQQDVRKIGNSFPRLQYGINFSLAYKGIGLSVLGYGTGGYDVYLNNSYYRPMPEASYSTFVRNSFNPETGLGTYPKLSTTNSANNYVLSDFWLSNGRFLRIKEAELKYSFPEKISRKVKLDRFTLFVRGNNLLTISKLKDVDPEYINAGITSYPFMRTFTAGFNLLF